MKRLTLLIIISSLVVRSLVAQDDSTSDSSANRPGTYLIAAPKTVRAGLPYAVSVNILKSDGPVTVTLKIIDSQNASLVQKVQQNVAVGSPVTVKIDKVPNSLVPEMNYRIYAKGETSAGKVLFEKSQPLNFARKSISTFVQTDKAIYKPGSTVHFRIITVYPDLKPYSGVAKIKITDPNRNVIQQLTNVSYDGGVIGKKDQMKLILTDEPPLGLWTIVVENENGDKTEKTFTVDKYVLPKFEVIVKPPSFITTRDDLFVTVSAKYTYGKGLEGSVTITVASPYYWNRDVVPISKTADLDKNGEATFRLTNAQLKESKLLTEWGQNNIQLTATATETLTGIKRNGTAEVTAYVNPYKLNLNKATETFQPGLQYPISISVTRQDDKTIDADADKRINLTIRYTFPYIPPPPNATNFETSREKVTLRLLALGQDGTLTYTIDTVPNANSMRIEASYGNGTNNLQQSLYIDASKSPSQSYIQISTEQTSVTAGEDMKLKVTTTVDVTAVTAQVMTRGYMVFIKNLPVSNHKAELSIPTTAEMAPKSRLIVYAVKPDNKEIIVGSMDIKVSGLLKNNVSISVDPKRAEPGNNVTFTIKASPKSYVGLLSVDQSVLLLKSGNDISQSMIESEIAQYDTAGSGGFWPWRGRSKRSICFRCGWFGISGKDAATIFENSGVLVMTDCLLYREPMPPKRPFRPHGPQRINLAGGGVLSFTSSRAQKKLVAERKKPAENEEITTFKVRNKFPETWTWTDVAALEDGKATYTAEVPDTITSWITTAFAIHDSDGLGVAPEAAKLEVFRPFFIRLNLPYSVKRGEKLALQVLLFNYMQDEQTVNVTLDHKDDSPFDLIPKPDAKKADRDANNRIIKVRGNGGSTNVFFPIIPTKVGNLKLLIKAIAQGAADAVESVLIVEAEGYPIFLNKPFIVDLTSSSQWSKDFALLFPPTTIPGSQKAYVSFVGDIMGPMLDNIDKLIQLPYGCGEQNMLNFVPNIVVTRYLKATSRLTPALQQKTKQYMEAGAQREMTYQRTDFSYSAFGQSDKAGSTWLTAFVARSFHQAKPYIFIDDEKLKGALQFLKSRQTENGAFREDGEIHHKAMQGGAGEPGPSLTAYVFLALIENDIKNAEALTYLEKSLPNISNDSYALAIVTYALHLANSGKKDEALSLLEKKATVSEGQKYWSGDASQVSMKKPNWYESPPSADVERTAYALLIYLARGDTSGAVPIVRWLVGQQNANGGYSTTQDTVIALQGLGAYAEKSYNPKLGSALVVKNGALTHTFEVNSDNAIVQQSYELKNYDQPVQLSARGSGVSFGQVSWHYNVPQLSDDQPFVCDKDVVQTNANEIMLSLCCKYVLEKQSNMALLEVEAPSGYVIDQEKLSALSGKVKDLQRTELENGDSKANIYYNKLGNEKVCANITSQRVFAVADQKPAIVKLTDYYSPSKQIRFDYSIAKKIDINEACGGDCWRDDRSKSTKTSKAPK